MQYPEVQIHQWKHEAFQILHKIKENCQTLGVFVFLYLSKRAYLRCLEGHLFLPYSDNKFLFAYLVRFRPLSVFTVENAAFDNNSFHLINHCFWYVCYDCIIFTLFSDKLVTFVLWIVVVFEFACRINLEIEKFMPISTTMTYTEWDLKY